MYILFSNHEGKSSEKVSSFVENFFRIHLRPIRLFYGASRPQIKFFKSSLLVRFGVILRIGLKRLKLEDEKCNKYSIVN